MYRFLRDDCFFFFVCKESVFLFVFCPDVGPVSLLSTQKLFDLLTSLSLLVAPKPLAELCVLVNSVSVWLGFSLVCSRILAFLMQSDIDSMCFLEGNYSRQKKDFRNQRCSDLCDMNC